MRKLRVLGAAVVLASASVSVTTEEETASLHVFSTTASMATDANGIGRETSGKYYDHPAPQEAPGAIGDYDDAKVYPRVNYSFDGLLNRTVEGGVSFSPDYFGKDGDGAHGYHTVGVTLSYYETGLSVTVGHPDGDKTTGAIGGYDDVHDSVGLGKSLGILTLDLS